MKKKLCGLLDSAIAQLTIFQIGDSNAAGIKIEENKFL